MTEGTKSGGPTIQACRLQRDDCGPAFDVHPAPGGNPGFREASRYAFEMPGPAWTFHVDDELLLESSDKPGSRIWEPGFYAGEVTAELRSPVDGAVTTYLLDVAPDATKTGRESFEQMLAEIWAEDPLLVTGTEPATRSIGSLGDSQDPYLELARLRRHGPLFARGLKEICSRPRSQLITRRESTPLHRVRRVDRQTAAAASRSRDVVSFLQGTLPEAASVASLRLDVPRVEESLDCAANRCLLALAMGVLRRVHNLRRRLQRQVDSESESATRTPLRARWPVRREFLSGLSTTLQRTLRCSPFTHVRRAEVSASGLNAVSSDPLYARAWRTGWQSLRRGVAGRPEDERMWISPTWEVYERWCFVRLGRCLREAAPQLGWTRLESDPTGATAVWSGKGGGIRVDLLLQPVFPGGHQVQKHDFWSISGKRIPDIVVAAQSKEGRRFFVLDAKYRQNRSAVLDSMTSAHIYHDSLRLADQRPEGALLLIPAKSGAPWLEEQDFQDEHGVGACTWSPQEETGLPHLLEEFLRRATS